MKSLRYATFVALVGWLTGSSVFVPSQAAEPPARKVAFNIPEQPLGDALRRFGEQTGLQVVLYSEIGRGLKAPKVSGDLTPQGALDRLLANSGLKYEYLNAQTVAISDGRRKDTSLLLAPAAMNLAQAGDAGRRTESAAPKSAIEAQEVVVESQRDRIGGNTDKTRTINDIQPYYIYDSETIERSGALDVEDFLKMRVTMNTVMMTGDQGQGGDGTQASNTFFIGPSASTVNLNGLGSNMTLVLIDGRRQAGPTGSGQVDLSALPTSSIDRIEILPSSASAIYGGSAMGGVVNVILKRNYTGGQAAVGYDVSENADDAKRQASLNYGFSLEGGRTNINTNISWGDSGILTLGDRQEVYEKAIRTIRANRPTFFNSGTSAWLGAGTNIVASETASPILSFLDGTSLGAHSTSVPDGFAAADSGYNSAALKAALLGNVNLYHDELVNTYQTTGLRRAIARGSDKQGVSVQINRDMTPWMRMSAGFRYNVNELNSPGTLTAVRFSVYPRSRAAGAAACTMTSTGGIGGLFPCAPNSPSPFQQTVSVAFPIYGELQSASTNINRAANLGISFTLPHRWALNVDLNHTRSSTNSWQEGGALTGTVQAAINAGTFNPFVDTVRFPLAIVEALRTEASPQSINSGQQFTATVQAQGPLMTLPWGAAPMSYIVLEHRRNAPDDSISIVSNDYGMRTYNNSIAAEVTMPLVRPNTLRFLSGLEMQLNGRMDWVRQEAGTLGYQTFGTFIFYNGPVTPEGLPFREMTSQTAPSHTIGLMYRPVDSLMLRASVGSAFNPPDPYYLAPNFPDPSNPLDTVTTVDDPDIPGVDSTVVNFLAGGNPGLRPETAETFNAGVIWQPHGALEGLRLNVEYMDTKRKDAILASVNPQFMVDNEDAFPGRVTRDAGGTITNVDARYVNAFSRTNSTLNFSGEYSTTKNGNYLSVSGQHTRILSIRSQNSITQPEYEAAGYPAEGGAVEDKSNLFLKWERNGFNASWTVSRLGAYKVKGAAGGPRSMANAAAPGTPTTADMNAYIIPQGGDTVPAQIRHDLTVGYSLRDKQTGGLFAGTALTLGVRNIFNVEPPMDVTYGGNFYINPVDRMRLRSFWLNMRKDF